MLAEKFENRKCLNFARMFWTLFLVMMRKTWKCLLFFEGLNELILAEDQTSCSERESTKLTLFNFYLLLLKFPLLIHFAKVFKSYKESLK